jgi:hypothetical protein
MLLVVDKKAECLFLLYDITDIDNIKYQKLYLNDNPFQEMGLGNNSRISRC